MVSRTRDVDATGEVADADAALVAGEKPPSDRVALDRDRIVGRGAATSSRRSAPAA